MSPRPPDEPHPAQTHVSHAPKTNIAGRMGRWSEGLFGFLYRNAKSATYQFCIPPTSVVEIGTQIDL
jgi:K+ transporter